MFASMMSLIEIIIMIGIMFTIHITLNSYTRFLESLFFNWWIWFNSGLSHVISSFLKFASAKGPISKLPLKNGKIFTLIEDVNELINDQQPWNLAKNIEQNKEQLHNVLTTCAYVFRNATIYLTPILPNLSFKVASLFNEDIFHDFNQAGKDIKNVTKYNHLLQRLESEQVENLLSENKELKMVTNQ